jgi:predicted N-acyltransferase
MHLERHQSLEAIDAGEWNRLVGDFPFLRHEFLVALERHGCVGPEFGWRPYYLVLRDAPGAPIAAAAPTFLKGNSYGEFVFDFAWAHAYERHGLAYYPKLIAAAPYTPATGPRLLVAPERDYATTAAALVDAVCRHVDQLQLSSLHWLFPNTRDAQTLSEQGLLLRTDVQYHWTNAGYRDFDDFLDRFTSRKRKKARRERRRVAEQGITLERRRGDEMDSDEWALAHHFYETTFERKWNLPVLTRGFFEAIGRTMGERIVVVFARHGGRVVAGSILLRGDDTLYGRYWGCDADYHSLHFEACYYQGIDYAIEQGLTRFEPGAQGEHKIARGFLPTLTQSAHWIRHPSFREAISDYIEREHALMIERYHMLQEESPFRADDDA